MEKIDVIIVGSGIAAMQLAHNLSQHLHVRIITKSFVKQSNSYLAQGGIAAAISKDDHYHLHFQDTIAAGQNFHKKMEVLDLVKAAPDIIEELIKSGVHFDMDENGDLCLGIEGAHCRNRILHCGGDATGRHIMEHFFKKVPGHISFTENEFVYELIIHPTFKKCTGVKTKDYSGKTKVYTASHVVLAVGGVGGLYSYTSNHESIAGDGVALAFRAGAELTDLEFIQFHPTLLNIEGKTCGLISEAVRGAGARLVNNLNEHIMDEKHPYMDLAPRHIVAQEIFNQRSIGHEVYLDIQMIQHFKKRFPSITTMCEKYGINISNGKIPVTPGCHFFMGGIVIDKVGRTNIDRLYAIGETAWSGIHGANRLASNSLLEGLYYGKKLASYLNLLDRDRSIFHLNIPTDHERKKLPIRLPSKVEIQQKMVKHAGIIRNQSHLTELKEWLDSYGVNKLMAINLDHFSVEEIQSIFMLMASKLITLSALQRTESRGGHIREDFPFEDVYWAKQHIVQTNKSIDVRRVQDEYNQIKIHA